jgi:hypothetical protein
MCQERYRLSWYRPRIGLHGHYLLRGHPRFTISQDDTLEAQTMDGLLEEQAYKMRQKSSGKSCSLLFCDRQRSVGMRGSPMIPLFTKESAQHSQEAGHGPRAHALRVLPGAPRITSRLTTTLKRTMPRSNTRTSRNLDTSLPNEEAGQPGQRRSSNPPSWSTTTELKEPWNQSLTRF